MLSGKQNISSPKSVAHASGRLSEEDDLKQNVDQLVTHFLNETIRIILIHIDQCGSMHIGQTDVKYAIEQFTKESVRGPSLYMKIGTAEDEENDEWEPSDEDSRSDDDYSSCDMDCELDQECFDIDESDNEAQMQCDERGEAWIRKPTDLQTPLFNSVFPPLAGDDNIFKISDRRFVKLAKKVMTTHFRINLNFQESSEKILKEALLRYIFVEGPKK